jgi:hypothetical protein
VTAPRGADDERRAAAAEVRDAADELARVEEQINALQRLRILRPLREEEQARYEALCNAERQAKARWRLAVKRHNQLAGPCGSGS